jgi:hypothetical protein
MGEDPAEFRSKRYRVPGGVIRHLHPNHWATQCHVCPKRKGRRNFDTREDADQWFASHLSPGSEHWLIRYEDPARKAKRTAEEDLLHAIFGA